MNRAVARFTNSTSESKATEPAGRRRYQLLRAGKKNSRRDFLREVACPRRDRVRFGGAPLLAQLAWLDAERTAAAAGALDVRVIEFEARTFDCLDVVNLHAVEIHFAHLIHENFQAVEFIDVVAVLIDLILESHVIAETRATAAHDSDAQAGGRGILLRQDFLHFGDGYWCQLYHSGFLRKYRGQARTVIPGTLYQIPGVVGWLREI